MTNRPNITYIVSPGGHLTGNIQVPGDKSISHRALMMGAIAEGITEISGFLNGEDTLATLAAFRQMGVTIEEYNQTHIRVRGVGLYGLNPSSTPLDLGNSGTSMRLMAGLLAGQRFSSTLTGDESLSKRPMRRIITPLNLMGTDIQAADNDTAPLTITGGKILQGINYKLPMASAQVKSCLILAGLYAEGQTTIIEPEVTRDHTERMLGQFGVKLTCEDHQVTIQGGSQLTACSIQVPSDLSSAAFFIVGACIAEQSNLVLTNVGINPTRTGIIDILRAMGAVIEITNIKNIQGEPIADLCIRSSQLQGIEIPEDSVSLAIDEFPAIFIAAACAEGSTVLRGAKELRTKESDRISVMAEGLQNIGIKANPTDDGIIIEGGTIQGGEINSHGDHRIAMSFAMAALRSQAQIIIHDCANVNTSFPGFVDLAKHAGLEIQEITI